MAKDLGCPAGSLEAEPYKLMVYEPGGFFAAHRDTEKTDGMIATLTISLPATSAGSGGGLLVRHGEREMRVDMAVSQGDYKLQLTRKTTPGDREGCGYGDLSGQSPEQRLASGHSSTMCESISCFSD